ncbi:MAG: hypothetical protein K0R73_1085 [Candidatus Midichloriaceae bacterium]|jgi:hypothetical protein|nr:hypothetical protein [Candidatus Midichloriaceae bacterium]
MKGKISKNLTKIEKTDILGIFKKHIGKKAYIINEALPQGMTYSPLDCDEALANCLLKINGFTCNGDQKLKDFILNDPLTKPIVIILEKDQYPLVNVNVWFACVIVPTNYNNLSNSTEIVYFINPTESISQDNFRSYFKTFERLLKETAECFYNTKGKSFVKLGNSFENVGHVEIGGAFPNAKFEYLNLGQTYYLNSLQYSVYNAIKIVEHCASKDLPRVLKSVNSRDLNTILNNKTLDFEGKVAIKSHPKSKILVQAIKNLRDDSYQKNKYINYYDDSSSSEEALNRDQDNKFILDELTPDEEYAELLGITFKKLQFGVLLHELGLRVLKSVEVSEQYYGLKRQYLRNTDIPDDKMIADNVSGAILMRDANSNTFDQCKNQVKQKVLSDRRAFVKAINFKRFKGFFEEFASSLPNGISIDYSTFSSLNKNSALRTTLPNNFIIPLEHYSPRNFLAWVRLLHKSNIRLMKNLLDNDQISIINRDKEVLIRVFNFPNCESAPALDKQEIYKKSHTRTDLVINSYSYSGIYKKLEHFKQELNLTDSKIALIIEKTFKGDLGNINNIINKKNISSANKKEFIEFINSLTYLLFATEVMRNPATLIINFMMIDLIKAEELSWEKAFSEDMPMAMSDAVKACRWLHSNLNTVMNYTYDKTTEKKNFNEGLGIKLLQKEVAIFTSWLELKKIKLTQDQEDQINLGLIDSKLNIDLFTKICEYCKKWYGIEVEPDGLIKDRIENYVDRDGLDDLTKPQLKSLEKIIYYSDNVLELYNNNAVSLEQLIKVYDESHKKFETVTSDAAMKIILSEENNEGFESICDLYDDTNDQEFLDIINDEYEKVLYGEISSAEVLDRMHALINKRKRNYIDDNFEDIYDFDPYETVMYELKKEGGYGSIKDYSESYTESYSDSQEYTPSGYCDTAYTTSRSSSYSTSGEESLSSESSRDELLIKYSDEEILKELSKRGYWVDKTSVHSL